MAPQPRARLVVVDLVSQPKEKKGKENKNPRRAHLSASLSPLFCRVALHASSSPAILARRATCRPSSRSVPPLRSSLAPSPYPRRARPVSLQTLAESAPKSAIVAAGRAPVVADSPPSVSGSSIPRGESFFPLPSLGSTPNPAPSPPLQGRWRAPSPAATHRRRAAPLLPLLACIIVGELRHHLGHAMRPRPEPLQPRSAAPPFAGAAASRTRARGRAQARGQGRPWP